MTRPKITAAVEKLRSEIKTVAAAALVSGETISALLRGLNHIEDLVDDEFAELGGAPVSKLSEDIRFIRLSVDEQDELLRLRRGEAIAEARGTFARYGYKVCEEDDGDVS